MPSLQPSAESTHHTSKTSGRSAAYKPPVTAEAQKDSSSKTRSSTPRPNAACEPAPKAKEAKLAKPAPVARQPESAEPAVEKHEGNAKEPQSVKKEVAVAPKQEVKEVEPRTEDEILRKITAVAESFAQKLAPRKPEGPPANSKSEDKESDGEKFWDARTDVCEKVDKVSPKAEAQEGAKSLRDSASPGKDAKVTPEKPSAPRSSFRSRREGNSEKSFDGDAEEAKGVHRPPRDDRQEFRRNQNSSKYVPPPLATKHTPPRHQRNEGRTPDREPSGRGRRGHYSEGRQPGRGGPGAYRSEPTPHHAQESYRSPPRSDPREFRQRHYYAGGGDADIQRPALQDAPKPLISKLPKAYQMPTWQTAPANVNREFPYDFHPYQFIPREVPPTIPSIYVSDDDTVKIRLRENVFVDIAYDKAIRFCQVNSFACTLDPRAIATAIMHPCARVYQDESTIYAHFGQKKLVAINNQGVTFAMAGEPFCYMVNSFEGTMAMNINQFYFPAFQSEITQDLINQHAHSASRDTLEMIVRDATVKCEDNEICMLVHGLSVKQCSNGDVEISDVPRVIHASPSEKALAIKSQYIDVSIKGNEQCCLKRGMKRIHVSKSGMVAQDGSCSCTMDYFGKIIGF